jgi:hypothetical protein
MLNCGIKFAIFVMKIREAKLEKYMIGRKLAHSINLFISKPMEDLKMKKLLMFAVLPLFIAIGCTTQYQARAPYDDVYYSSKDQPASTSDKVVVSQSQVPATSDYSAIKSKENSKDAVQPGDNQNPNATEYSNYDDQSAGVISESYTDPGGDTYINNNYYDNYYDYAYASRLRRFHSNYYMDSYYSPYYSNLYFYDYNPWSWGTSIYFNSGWYSPFFGLSFGWGWPSYSYGWGYPSYGGYMNGYYDGYYDGYWAGNSNHGWYSNDGGNYGYSHYYGHRGQSGFIGGSSNGRNNVTSRDQKPGRSGSNGNDSENNRGYGLGSANSVNGRMTNMGDANLNRGENAPLSDNKVNGRSLSNENNRTNVSGRTNERNTQNMQAGRTKNPGYRGRYYAPASYTQRKPNSGSYTSGRTTNTSQPRISNPQKPVNDRSNVNNNSGSQINTGRESNLPNSSQSTRSYQTQKERIQSYSSPSYTKPRSSQEYTTPKYRNIRNNDNPSPSPRYSQPPPQRTIQSGNNERRNSESQRQPEYRQSTERQQSSPTYSAPSRSRENSYSAPTRSENNSGSSSSPSRSSSGSSNSSNSSGSGRPRR